MTRDQAMKALRAMGTAQNRKVYARHGAQEPLFGVSFANLGKLAKKLEKNQALAEGLWASNNHDARVLAAMIADPATAPKRVLAAWVRQIDSYPISDAFARHFAAKSQHARALAQKWSRSPQEFVGRAGWTVISILAMEETGIEDRFFTEQLAYIEKQIHRAKNRKRESMNTALIAIGSRSVTLEQKAIAAAKRIGPVEIDHGQTGCKTPDPIAYIEKSRGRWAKKRTKIRAKRSKPAKTKGKSSG